MQKVKKWFSGMRAELKKIVWPTKGKLAKNTGVSVVVMMVMALLMFGFDQVGQAVVRLFVSFM